MTTTISRPRPSRTKRRHGKTSGWVPNQHGAWAMVIMPYVVGAGLHIRDTGWSWYLLPLFGAWLCSYFAFNAASLWIKSKRKARFRRPLLVYATITGALGLLALLLTGPALLGWGVLLVPLASISLLLVALRRERSTLSGLLTILAAALMAVAAGHPNPLTALQPGAGSAWWLAALSFAYYFGTVPYVKTLVRERGHRSWVIGSVAYHAIVVVLGLVAAAAGWLSWLWVGFFLLLTLRAWLVPALGPLSGRTVSPKHAGFAEMGTTAVFAVLGLTLL